MTPDELIDKIVEHRDEIARLNVLLDEQQELKAIIEAQLMQFMAENNLKQLGSTHGTASYKMQQVPTIEDWALFASFVVKTGNVHLLQKRISTPTFSELVEQGTEIPGVGIFTRPAISIRRK